MEISERRNIWHSVSEEVQNRTYGEDGEYNLDQLEKDLYNEGFLLRSRAEEDLEQAYNRLERIAYENGQVNGEELKDILSHYLEN